MTQITLLDGGMGQELVHRSGNKPTPLWSTQVMLDHPGMVEGVHTDFFTAGATIATTNTYAILRDRLAGTPFESQFEDLYAHAIGEASAARELHGSGRIAGAIGPLFASYRPDLHPDAEVGTPIYAEIAGLLAPSCDLLILETVVSLTHAKSVLAGAGLTSKPLWLSVSVNDQDGTKLRSGEPLSDILPIAQGKAAALLVNCSSPEAIPAAFNILAQGGVPYGAYANAFEQITQDFLKDKPTVDALQMRRDMTPTAYEVSPAHIAEIAKRLRAAGHEIV
jgi:S-methylmethionine-dependent homocysteine/selenocysteine methylase